METKGSLIVLTEAGKAWVDQMDESDRALARRLLDALTLVSHTEFERSLIETISAEADKFHGPVALFATREMTGQPYLDVAEVDAVGSGSDLGSEARVAAIIRGLHKQRPDKFLRHPTIDEMHSAKCRAIFMIDDFIGSGQRTCEFFGEFWKNRRLRSWHSLHLLSFVAVCYSSTEVGRKTVERGTRAKVVLRRECPTFGDLPWSKTVKEEARVLLYKYGKRTEDGYFYFGFGDAGAALVFEHGCPDNCPAIFWSQGKPLSSWSPLFPKRSVTLSVASAFPHEIANHELSGVLLDAGEKKLAMSGALSRRGPIGEQILTILGLLAQGVRNRSAFSYATGLPALKCAQVVERCIKWQFVTPRMRLTAAGYRELQYARVFTGTKNKVPDKGSDVYYPTQLRGSAHG